MSVATDVALFDPIPPHAAGMALHRAVGQSLLASIEAGIHAPGGALPSEAALAAAFSVSIGTVRKAVDDLVARGLVVRRQGRGTYVSTHAVEAARDRYFRLERADGGRDTPEIDVLQLRRGPADPVAAHALELPDGTPTLQIDWLVRLRGAAVGCERLTLPAALFKGLTEKRLRERAAALYAWYQSDFGVTVVRAVERVGAVVADRSVRDALGLPIGAAVLYVHRLALGFNNRPVECRQSWFHTARHELVTALPTGAPP